MVRRRQDPGPTRARRRARKAPDPRFVPKNWEKTYFRMARQHPALAFRGSSGGGIRSPCGTAPKSLKSTSKSHQGIKDATHFDL